MINSDKIFILCCLSILKYSRVSKVCLARYEGSCFDRVFSAGIKQMSKNSKSRVPTKPTKVRLSHVPIEHTRLKICQQVV